jgi:hypothetical protein
MKWKSLVSWKKRNNLGRDNKERNKNMAREELLENKQGDNWAHWHHKRERPLETLTSSFQKLEISFWKKNARKP